MATSCGGRSEWKCAQGMLSLLSLCIRARVCVCVCDFLTLNWGNYLNFHASTISGSRQLKHAIHHKGANVRWLILKIDALPFPFNLPVFILQSVWTSRTCILSFQSSQASCCAVERGLHCCHCLQLGVGRRPGSRETCVQHARDMFAVARHPSGQLEKPQKLSERRDNESGPTWKSWGGGGGVASPCLTWEEACPHKKQSLWNFFCDLSLQMCLSAFSWSFLLIHGYPKREVKSVSWFFFQIQENHVKYYVIL